MQNDNVDAFCDDIYNYNWIEMNDEKLKNLGGGDYWHELLERIRDIRSSEKVMYRQIRDNN